MTTPQGSRLPAGAAATPPTSTPHSSAHLLANSPRGPRTYGVSPQASKRMEATSSFGKSPANSQRLIGKSPANSQHLYYPSTASMAGTPGNTTALGISAANAVSFGTPALNFDSPTTQAALASLPMPILDGELNGLGVSGMDLPLGMNLGGPALVMPGAQDEAEKRRRLRAMIEILGQTKGRVSEEGVERIARRVGLECLWEDGMGAGSLRTLIIAGTGVSIDVDFANSVVTKATLTYPDAPDVVLRHAASATRVVGGNLQLMVGESVWTKRLDKFAMNLERLATLDKLSILPEMNLHHAIAGMYESLDKLYTFQLGQMNDILGPASKQSTRELYVLRRRSGQPAMNINEQVGLSIAYWQEQCLIPQATKKTWSLIIECAVADPMGYAPVRVSDSWISDAVVKDRVTIDDMLEGESIIDWQEPPSIVLPLPNVDKNDVAMAGMDGLAASMQNRPSVMFVAKFDPPLVMPAGEAMNIYSAINAAMPVQQHLDVPTINGYPTIDSLWFNRQTLLSTEPDGTYRRLISSRDVPIHSPKDGKAEESQRTTLTFNKMEFGHVLHTLPFSHPRQLIEAMPILRQYAALSHIITNAVNPITLTELLPAADGTMTSPQPLSPIPDTYEAFLASCTAADLASAAIAIDVTIQTTMIPPLVRLNFPLREHAIDILFAVGDNGIPTVMSENLVKVVGGRNRIGEVFDRAVIEKCIMALGDLGRVAAYLRMRL